MARSCPDVRLFEEDDGMATLGASSRRVKALRVDAPATAPDNLDRSPEAGVSRFDTTSWSLILRAAQGDDAEARLALALLCEHYWYPVYAYVRRQGTSAADAEDLTQGYFARFLEKGVVRDVKRDRGRFRAFLLASVRHYLSNERDRDRAQKRGGGRRLVSLDAEVAEQRFASMPVDLDTPETQFERNWALALLERARERLAVEASRRGGAERFARLRPYLEGGEPETGYGAIAREWGVGESAVRVALHRLRRRYREVLREEVGRTVERPQDVDDELRHMLGALGA
jgi:RNA polymerase sigma factor (sigma-70 family)